MGARIRAHDWAATPLGPIEAWPQGLRTALRLMLTTRHPVFIFWGPDHRCLYNDAYAASLGPEAHPRILGIPFREAMPEAWPLIGWQVDQVMQGGEPTWHEDHLVPIWRFGRQEEVYWTYSFGPIDDPAAQHGVGGVLVLCHETTRRVHARQDAEARYSMLFQAIDEAFCIVEVLFDAEGRACDYRFVEVNPAFLRHTGLQDAEGRTALELVPDLEPYWFQIYGDVALTGAPTRFENHAAGLDDRWYDVYAFRVGDPAQRRVAILFNDITKRRRAEMALSDREERLRLIVEGARDYAIFTTDAEGLIDLWPPGAAAVFGRTEDQAIGRPAAITFTPEDRDGRQPERQLALARRDGTAPDVGWRLRHDGIRVFIEGSVSAMRHADGRIRGFLRIGQDVTRRRAGEERQALLTREVDHRAKNALAVVQTILRLTRAENLSSFASIVEGRVAALARAQTLLAEEQWAGADLDTLLRGELAPFLGGARVQMSGPPLVLPPGMAQPLAMAVHELATNAAKHGALSVEAGQVHITWERCPRQRDDESARLCLQWRESGGPAIAAPPGRHGFGARVLDGTIRRQLGGSLSLDWRESGLACGIEVPLANEDTGLADQPVEPSQTVAGM
ncbi:PAS domain-containing protein [Falsiroseomonas sp. E2-1-a20]|uniref:PAS domain-containing protein n=1 Tax=Falsiroseomonas sp. E2-1-a20 TaxID=3239300 RepID=UPI003F33FFA7